MNSIKKNIVLSNKNSNNNEMALLSLERLSHGVVCTIKTFNLMQDNLVLLISQANKQVFLDKINLKNNQCQIDLHSLHKITDDIECALFSEFENQVSPLVWNKNCSTMSLNLKPEHITKTVTQQHSDVSKNLNDINLKLQKHGLENVEQQAINREKTFHSQVNLDELFELEENKQLEKLIDDEFKKENNTNRVFEQDTAKIKETIKTGELFFDLVSSQIEDLFSKYPAQQSLENLIPNSKWVVVEFEDSQDPYVLGLIYDDINIKYICYGISGDFSSEPPKDLENYSQWLPLDPNNVSLGGYWIMYQDAISGENVKIDNI